MRRSLGLVLAIILLARCRSADKQEKGKQATTTGPLVLYNAAAVARPMRAVLDSFSSRTGIKYNQQSGASLELARKVTELGDQPDVLVLADPDIFRKLLEPRFTTWYVLFARNRIVVAYTSRSKGAETINSSNWMRALERPGVEVGRADPQTDPSGYRTLLAWQLAERYYKQPGLYDRMLAAAPPKNVRPREADQVALLQTGDLDYIWTYQNLADNAGLKYVKLPDAVDMGEPADSVTYSQASTRVLGKRLGDTVEFRGAPILFGVTVTVSAPHMSIAERFVAFLLSRDGSRILKSQHFDALDRAILRGSRVPNAVTRAATQ